MRRVMRHMKKVDGNAPLPLEPSPPTLPLPLLLPLSSPSLLSPFRSPLSIEPALPLPLSLPLSSPLVASTGNAVGDSVGVASTGNAVGDSVGVASTGNAVPLPLLLPLPW